MARRQDTVIVGAGCAGLSLAVHLSRAGLTRGGLTLIESQDVVRLDRTWCFWNVHPTLFDAKISHRWKHWRVRGGDDHDRPRERVCDVPGIDYVHLRGSDFCDEALRILSLDPDVKILTGAAVRRLEDCGDHVEVETSTECVHASRVFDSRPMHWPPDTAHDDPPLWQRFHGWEITTKEPRFDADTVDLMDFTAGPEARFTYVLPYDRHRALIEDTFFTARRVSENEHTQSIESYIARHVQGSAWTRVRTESGSLPMTTMAFDPRPSKRVYRIGIAGGMARPSTGYAFASIQRFSAMMTKRLSTESLPDPPRVRSRRSGVLDAAVLRFLTRWPQRASALFLALFENVKPRRLVRFLSDDTGLADDLAVMAATPVLRLLSMRDRQVDP